jgi:glucosyl-dolichyl phosphate glucuronosyltransferase
MQVSVVICTWNRCELLRSTLESFRSLVVPAEQEWELLVVNNNSPDATDEVVTAYQALLPLRRLFESEVGLSRARNTGARAATGELILFTDDDIRVDPNWMTAYLEAVKRWPNAGYFGGEIRPWFAAEVPSWVKRNQTALAGMLCLRDVGPVSRGFRPGEFPYGPNMAVRRRALALASFDERVGRKGHEQMRNSEHSLFWSLQEQGVPGVWVPGAQVYHYIPRRRANFRYLWNYYRGIGRSGVRLSGACGSHPRRRLLSAGLRALIRTCLRPRDWPQHVANVARISGQLSVKATRIPS